MRLFSGAESPFRYVEWLQLEKTEVVNLRCVRFGLGKLWIPPNRPDLEWFGPPKQAESDPHFIRRSESLVPNWFGSIWSNLSNSKLSWASAVEREGRRKKATYCAFFFLPFPTTARLQREGRWEGRKPQGWLGKCCVLRGGGEEGEKHPVWKQHWRHNYSLWTYLKWSPFSRWIYTNTSLHKNLVGQETVHSLLCKRAWITNCWILRVWFYFC